MCGFVGYVQEAPASGAAGGRAEAELARWSEIIAHRGPDQHGEVRWGPFGLGTRRLAIQDLTPAGYQPMQGEQFLLGFNGEIYNHWEVRRELAAEGIGPDAFRGHSDTETVLRAVEHWGIDRALAKLNGIYALALWNKAEGTLTLARDPLGVKPLNVLRGPEGIRFASELKALREFAGGQLDQRALALFLVFGFVPSPYTLLRGVQKLRPGEILEFRGEEVRRSWVQPEAWAAPPRSGPVPPAARAPQHRRGGRAAAYLGCSGGHRPQRRGGFDPDRSAGRPPQH